MNRYLALLPPGGVPAGYIDSIINTAKEAGSGLKAVYVVDSVWFNYSASDWLSTGPSRAGFDEYMRDTLRQEGEALTREFHEAAAGAGLQVSTEIAEGDLALTLVKAARDFGAGAVIIPSGQKDMKALLEKSGITVIVT
jgi:hypothetical protein